VVKGHICHIKLSFHSFNFPYLTMKDNLVLIDTDAGTDDALAIWLLLKAHQDPENSVKVVGVTCVNGNTAVDNVAVNVARILKASGELGKVGGHTNKKLCLTSYWGIMRIVWSCLFSGSLDPNL
jgi:hypothetical protein